MGKIVLEDMTVEYSDSPEAKEELFQRMLKWHVNHHALDGECIWQSDMCMESAPEILTDVAENVFKFKVTYTDEV